MTDAKNEIAVYTGTETGDLIRPDEPVTARNTPAIVKAAGKSAEFARAEFFQAEIYQSIHPQALHARRSGNSSPGSGRRNLELPRIAPADVGEEKVTRNIVERISI